MFSRDSWFVATPFGLLHSFRGIGFLLLGDPYRCSWCTKWKQNVSQSKLANLATSLACNRNIYPFTHILRHWQLFVGVIDALNEKWTRVNVCSYVWPHSWFTAALSFFCSHFSAFEFSFWELHVCASRAANEKQTIAKVSSWVRWGPLFTTTTFIFLHSFRATIFFLWEFFVGVIGAQNGRKLELKSVLSFVSFFICGDSHSFFLHSFVDIHFLLVCNSSLA